MSDEDRDIQEYTFDTEIEASAFVNGVSVGACGDSSTRVLERLPWAPGADGRWHVEIEFNAEGE